MARESFNALTKTKRHEASARAEKRRVVSAINKEVGAAARKYFPELDSSEKVNGKVVPVVDDVDEFFKEVADIYHGYERAKDVPVSKFWNLVATGKIWR